MIYGERRNENVANEWQNEASDERRC
jgi:hypothetical protein